MASGRYLALLHDAADLHIRKSAGYAGKDNPDTWANFREAERWGLTPLQGCLVRMGDKFVRAQNLVRDPANEQVGEALRETLVDLMAYAGIAVCLLDEQTLGPEEPVWPDENGLLPLGERQRKALAALAEARDSLGPSPALSAIDALLDAYRVVRDGPKHRVTPNTGHIEGPMCKLAQLHWHPEPQYAAYWPLPSLLYVGLTASPTLIRPIKGWLTGERLWHEQKYEDCAKHSIHAHRLDVDDGLSIEYTVDYVAPRGVGAAPKAPA